MMARLQARVAELEAENAELRRRLGMNSANSSKPPSSDGPDKAPPKSLRKKTGRRSAVSPVALAAGWNRSRWAASGPGSTPPRPTP